MDERVNVVFQGLVRLRAALAVAHRLAQRHGNLTQGEDVTKAAEGEGRRHGCSRRVRAAVGISDVEGPGWRKLVAC